MIEIDLCLSGILYEIFFTLDVNLVFFWFFYAPQNSGGKGGQLMFTAIISSTSWPGLIRPHTYVP